MKKILLFVLLSSAAIVRLQSQPSIGDRQIAFRNVNVIPMDGNRVLEGQTVVTMNGRIITMGGAADLEYASNAIVIDARGKYLIPGLAEMHAHIPPSDDVEAMKEVLKLFALNGITTIRGMLGHPRHLELRESIRRGEVPGPHLYTTGVYR